MVFPPLQGASLIHMGMRLKAIEYHRRIIAGILSQAQPLSDLSEYTAAASSSSSASSFSSSSSTKPSVSRWSEKEQEILKSFAVNVSDTQSGGVDLEELEALTRSVDTLLQKGGRAQEREETGSGSSSAKARQLEKKVCWLLDVQYRG